MAFIGDLTKCDHRKMKDRDCLALRVRSGRLTLLDQSRLPHVQAWFAVDDVDTLVEAIHALRTRGAPMIAIAAALSGDLNLKEAYVSGDP